MAYQGWLPNDLGEFFKGGPCIQVSGYACNLLRHLVPHSVAQHPLSYGNSQPSFNLKLRNGCLAPLRSMQRGAASSTTKEKWSGGLRHTVVHPVFPSS